jgi:glycosyltransferase involved in cell wall biosynthesis
LNNTLQISVIISTYNSEEWLEKVLWSYNAQTFKDFELIIADDGSKNATFDLIKRLKVCLDYNIIHVWHEDNGFQKSQILNKGIIACNTDYILMSDGDCIVRNDFVETHIKYREKGYFLSGGYFMLPMSISKLISKEDILNQYCFDLDWLKQNGLKSSFKNIKLTAKGFLQKILNCITPTNASWNGHNSSGWKSDILAVNGFDERMQYGGQDRELGERLFNLGIRSKQIRYSAICLHLDHPRGYKTQESINKNLAIRATTVKEKKSWTNYGIIKN